MLTKEVLSIVKRRARSGLLVLGVLCLFAALLPMTTSPVRAASSPAARPGYVEGKVVTSDGRFVKNAYITVREYMSTGDPTKYKVYYALTGEDGTYSVKVGDGIGVKVEAQAKLPYQGYSWVLPLHPDDNSNSMLDPSKGVVKNFTWKLHGLMVGYTDPSNPGSYYGAWITVALPTYPPAPEGKVLTFRFMPVGPLVDGSAGGGLLFREQILPGGTLPNHGYLMDIPLGRYTLTATQTTRSGQTIPLLLYQGSYVPGRQGSTSLDIKFQPDQLTSTNGIKWQAITALPSSD